ANGTVVGVTAYAPDPNNPSVTYTLTDSAGGRFAIDPGSGVVTVANGALLNYETAASHSVTVQASDGAGGTSTQTFIIAVLNLPPVVTAGSPASIAFGATYGGSFSFTDAAADGPWTYAIAFGDGATQTGAAAPGAAVAFSHTYFHVGAN